jgi:protein O-GlcNAc transferase
MTAKANAAERLHKVLSAGHLFLERGQLSSARNKFREAVKLAPQDPRGHFFLGAALLAQNNAAEALPALRDADRLAPDNVDVVSNLGLALSGVGDKAAARTAMERAVALRPDDDRIKINLAHVLIDLGVAAHALEMLSGLGNSGAAWLARAEALIGLDRPMEALEATRAARAADPESPEIAAIERIARLKLGAFGNAADAVMMVEESIANAGGDATAPVEFLNLRATRLLRLDGGASGRTRDAHLAIGRRYEVVRTLERSGQSRSSERLLNIGLVSPDLREHSVMNFLLGPLAAFDPTRIEIHLYSNTPKPDGVTERAKAFARSHLDIRAMDAETAARRIRDDAIDILIDLAGHTGGNRLDVFGYRPAPIQMTWLGYPFSTGMKRVQYRLSDMVADPPDLPRSGYTERFVYLKHFLCFAPLDEQEQPKPRSGDAPLVFGAFNNLDKYDSGTLRYWARVMDRLPGSVLKIRQRHLRHAEACAAWRDRLAEHGFDLRRVDLGPFDDSRPDAHFTIHDEVDICLDPLIYNGTTTTCNALWMGVPVIVVADEPHASRVGASLMAAAGLPEFFARDEADAVEKIVALAQDRARLAEYRATLRSRLQTSPLCDADGFARDFEAKLRDVWRDYCAKA